MHTQTHTNTLKEIKYPNTHTATYSNISLSADYMNNKKFDYLLG